MITSLMFLTVSAFSTPLLENATYSHTKTSCSLQIKEERLQTNVVLAMSANRNNDYQVKIYHLTDLQAPSRGSLSLQSIDNNEQLPQRDNNYIVDHNLFKRVDDKTVIYTTTIANDNVSPQQFAQTFQEHGYRSRLYIDGLNEPLSFTAGQQQADAFFRCANSSTSLSAKLANR